MKFNLFYLFTEVSVGHNGSIVKQGVIETVGSELVELKNQSLQPFFL